MQKWMRGGVLAAAVALVGCTPPPQETDAGQTTVDAGVEADAGRDCRGSTRQCHPDGDESIVFVDGCGEVRTVLTECDADEECLDHDPNDPSVPMDARCVTVAPPDAGMNCTGRERVCHPDGDASIVYVDSCNNVVGVVRECNDGYECTDTDPNNPDRPIDARCSRIRDAGNPPTDAGNPTDDAGNPTDGGPQADAGPTDGGSTPDGGVTFVGSTCDPQNPQVVYGTDAQGNIIGEVQTCSPATQCEVHSVDGDAYCACPLTGELTCSFPNGISNLYEPSMLIKERSCGNVRDEPTDLIEDCGFGSMCNQDDALMGGQAHCGRSVSDETSPYYDFSCTAEEWMRHPTALEVDCRCRRTGDGQGGAGGTGNAYADPNNTDITMGARPGGPVINCATSSRAFEDPWPVAYGTGPNFNAWFQQNASGASWFSGVFRQSSREMFAIIKWTNPNYSKSATIVAWNVDTKNRRVVSGLYPDRRVGQQPFGSGYLAPAPDGTGASLAQTQPLTGANVLRWGPDGMLYVWGGGTGEGTSSQRQITKVDPDTGARTLVWAALTPDNAADVAAFGQCIRPEALSNPAESVHYQAQAFEVGPDGSFYLSMRDIRGGDGIVKISADATACSYISRWGGDGHNPGGGTMAVPPPAPIGMGIGDMQFPVQGLLYHVDPTYGAAIYGVENGDLYSFNLATGFRARESYDTSGYEGMGYANMFWDSSRNVIWAVGTVAPYVGSIVDLTTGRRESVYGDSGRQEHGAAAILNSVYAGARSVGMGTALSNGRSIGHGGFVLDPMNNDIAYAVTKGGELLKYELSTFNNYVHSF